MADSSGSVADFVIFEPYFGGHRAEYISHLLTLWNEKFREERLVVAGPAKLFSDLEALSPGFSADAANDLSFLELPQQNHYGSTLQLGRKNGQLLKLLTNRFQPTHVLAMYLDHLQLALATGGQFGDVSISGILFRPSLHHETKRRRSFREMIAHQGKIASLKRMASNPNVGAVFSLNPIAVPSLRKLGLDAISLPDPVEASESGLTREDVRSQFGIRPDRMLFLLFGMLDRRKGLFQLLEALDLLSSAESGSVAVLLAGPISEAAKIAVRKKADFLQHNSEMQLVVHDVLIPVADVQSIVKAADVVLAPYVGHIGSSAVLVRAAAAGIPVLSTNSDLMGVNVKTHALGLTVDASSPAEIAEGIRKFLADSKAGFGEETAKQWASSQTPAAFAQTILNRLYP